MLGLHEWRMNVKIIRHNEFYRAVAPFPNEWKERWVNEFDVLDRIDCSD